MEDIEDLLEGNVTVDEILDELDPSDAYNVFYGGRFSPRVDEKSKRIIVDEEGIRNLEEPDIESSGYRYVFKAGKTLDKYLAEKPKELGRKYARENSIKSSKTGETMGKSTKWVSAGVFTLETALESYLFVESGKYQDILLPEPFGVIIPTAGIITGYYIEGLYEQRIEENCLRILEEEFSNYNVVPE